MQNCLQLMLLFHAESPTDFEWLVNGWPGLVNVTLTAATS